MSRRLIPIALYQDMILMIVYQIGLWDNLGNLIGVTMEGLNSLKEDSVRRETTVIRSNNKSTHNSCKGFIPCLMASFWPSY